ncbi:MAG: hypothetical protein SFT68_00830 [Rickettsiaceae bacterium]|nr:hypothetical protein [Rickettsiaceae bacterium]
MSINEMERSILEIHQQKNTLVELYSDLSPTASSIFWLLKIKNYKQQETP